MRQQRFEKAVVLHVSQRKHTLTFTFPALWHYMMRDTQLVGGIGHDQTGVVTLTEKQPRNRIILISPVAQAFTHTGGEEHSLIIRKV